MDKMKIHLIQMKIDELLAVCDEHNNDPGELINILHAAQGIFGYLPVSYTHLTLPTICSV